MPGRLRRGGRLLGHASPHNGILPVVRPGSRAGTPGGPEDRLADHEELILLSLAMGAPPPGHDGQMTDWDDPDVDRAPICPYCGVTPLPAELAHVLYTKVICDNARRPSLQGIGL